MCELTIWHANEMQYDRRSHIRNVQQKKGVTKWLKFVKSDAIHFEPNTYLHFTNILSVSRKKIIAVLFYFCFCFCFFFFVGVVFFYIFISKWHQISQKCKRLAVFINLWKHLDKRWFIRSENRYIEYEVKDMQKIKRY